MSYTNNYSRGQIKKRPTVQEAPESPSSAETEEGQIRVDGFEQVLEMLRIADPAFRESLLKRLAARDRKLAESLRADLAT